MQKYFERFALVGIPTAIIISIVVAFNSFFHPSYRSQLDYPWLIFYAVVLAGIAFLWWTRRWRLLFRLSVACLAVFLLTVFVFSDNGPALLSLAWLVILAAGLGKKLLDWSKIPGIKFSYPSEELIFSIGLGMIVLTIMTLVLSLGTIARQKLQPIFSFLPDQIFVWLHPIPVFIVLIALSAWVAPGLWRTLRLFGVSWKKQWTQLWRGEGDGLAAGGFAVFLVCLIIPALYALTYTVRFDALTYHLTIPARYIAAHGMINIPELYNSYWSHYAEILYTLALLISGQPLPSLLHLTFGLLTTGLIFLLGRRLGGPRVGLIAALLFFSVPLISYETGSAYIDLIQAFFTLGAVYAVMLWWQGKNSSWLLIGGIFTGFALGIKISTVNILLPLGISFVILLFMDRRWGRDKAHSLLLFCLPAFLIAVPWPIRDYLWSGNPIFPMYNSFFKSPLWVSAGPMFALNSVRWSSPLNFLLIPWDLVANTGKFYREAPNGMLSALSLLALPWFYLSREKLSRRSRQICIWLGGLLIVSLIIFNSSSTIARYMIPLFGIMAVLAAINIEAGLKTFHKMIFPFLSSYASVGLLVIGVFFLLSTRAISIVRSYDIRERFPVNAALGFESMEDFLSRNLPVYDTFRYLDHVDLSVRKKVLAVGTVYSYYTDAEIVPLALVQTTGAFTDLDKPLDELANELNTSGYNYLIISWDDVKTYGLESVPYLQKAFLQKYAQLLYARNNVYLYRLNPQGNQPNDLALLVNGRQNLLENVGFEDLDQGKLTSWKMFGDPQLLNEGMSGNRSIRVSEQDVVIQDIPVEPEQLYTYGYWMRGDDAEQKGRLQVLWYDANYNLLDVAAFSFTPGVQWNWEQLSETSPEGAAYASVYVTADSGSHIWADDAVFQAENVLQPLDQ